MKGIKWILIGLILLLTISNVSAHGPSKTYTQSDDGLGVFSFTSTGSSTYTNYLEYVGTSTLNAALMWYYSDGSSSYVTIYTEYGFNYDQQISRTDINKGVSKSYELDNISPGQFRLDTEGVYDTTWTVTMSIYVTDQSINKYTISGDTNCVDWVELYVKNNDSTYSVIGKNTSSYYEFSIINGLNYKLVFSDGYEYAFTCDENKTYNYNACGYCTININDNCANLLNGAFTVIYDKNTGMNVVYSGYDNPINILSTDINENDELTVVILSWCGAVQKTCIAQFDNPINLYDQFIYWDMEVYVYDNESSPIDNANVDFNQDCVIQGYPVRNKYTGSDGLASFTQCENKGATLTVSKDGYKTLSTSVSGGWYNAYQNTYQVSVMLQSSDSDNSSTWDLINNSINDTNATETPNDIPDVGGVPNDIVLYFRNTNGGYVTQINDSDTYIRCYYSVNTPDDVNMTLVFQKSHSGYYFYDVDTYTYSIDNNSYGYFNISNSYFNDSTYSYRAYIYDYAYPFDDRYAYLNVINQTTTPYKNLTGYCMFMNTNKNGSIDYREDIICYAMVISDNTSLKTVSLELYDNSTLIDYKNLTWSDFTNDDIYGWELGYNYTLNYNYSLILKGYDGSILDVDNVRSYNLVGNKLTIKVTDSFNHPLNHVYIFCEHYGSINTGYLNYGTFEGLPDGESRYKASKSGYRSGLWSTVNLTSENEVVTYQLTQEKSEGSISAVKMSDNDVKDLYYPFMYFLLIIILIGALMNVIK